MKNLNRFEYLQLAAQLLPKEMIIKEHANMPSERLYEILVEEMFVMAKVIRADYEQRYRYEGDNDEFELATRFERGEL